MKKDSLSSGEKLDLILKYTKSARHWRMVSAFVSLVFFLVFIVLPVVGAFFLVDFVKEYLNSDSAQNLMEQINTAKSHLDNFSDFMNSFGR